MSRGICVIGVGGSGQNVLIALKERLVETFGQVPDSVTLLSLDTAAPEAAMAVGGINLNIRNVRQINVNVGGEEKQEQIEPVEIFLAREREVVERGRPDEFFPIITDVTQSVDSVIQDVMRGVSPHFKDWVEVEAMSSLPQNQKNIAAGAGQRRPLGRVALFLNYPGVYTKIDQALQRLSHANVMAGDKYNIFVVGSVAGGTGSGTLIDVLTIVRKILTANRRTQVSLTAFVVLPSAFQNQAAIRDKSNLQPNSYAALRELDRFQLTHASTRPTLIRYGTRVNDIEWITKSLADYVYLVDTSVPGAGGGEISQDPRYSVFPAIADFIAAKTADARGPDGMPGGGGYMIEALENNFDVTLHDRWRGRQYLGLNTFTYIVPINDIIRSLGFQYLHSMYERLFVEPVDKAIYKRQAAEQVEALLTQVKVGTLNRNAAPEEVPVPTIIRAVVDATKPREPHPVMVDWASLLNLLARTPDEYQEDHNAFEAALEYIESELLNSIQYSRKVGEKEYFDDGAARLVRLSNRLMDQYIGPLRDPKDPQSRRGGEWDIILGKYDELRDMFADMLDVVVRDELNRRNEEGKLLPCRLAAARYLVENLRERLKTVTVQLEQSLVQTGAPERYVSLITSELKEKQSEMEETAEDTFIPLFAERPLRRQKDYIEAVIEYLHLELSLRLFACLKRVLDVFGVEDSYEWKDDEGRAHKEPTVIARALNSLDNWQTALHETDEILEEARKRHEIGRAEKARIQVRRYVTDEEFENKIYERCRVELDRDLLGKGKDDATLQLHWARKRLAEDTGDEPPLIFELIAAWELQRAVGPVELALSFMRGARQTIEPVVRKGVTIVNRLQEIPEFQNDPEKLATALEQRVQRPLLRYQDQAAADLNRYTILSFPNWGRSNSQKFAIDVARYWSAIDTRRKVDARPSLEPGECAAALTTISFTGALAMSEVQQFVTSEAPYRIKTHKREPLHVFPEEQMAVQYEAMTPTVFQQQSTPRTFSPEVVVAMTDENKLLDFAAACAYEVIIREVADRNDALAVHEIFIHLPGEQGYDRRQLSHSALIPVSPGQVPTEGRLYLDALQQFCIVKTERPGIGPEIAALVRQQLEGALLEDPQAAKRPKDQINPFSLRIAVVERAIVEKKNQLGPRPAEQPDPIKRQQENAQRCLERIQTYKRQVVDKWMESEDKAVQDLGILMALLLQKLSQPLQVMAAD